MPDDLDLHFDSSNSRFASARPKTPLMVRVVLGTGIVRDEDHANFILMLLALAGISLSFFLFFYIGKGNTAAPGQAQQAQATAIMKNFLINSRAQNK